MNAYWFSKKDGCTQHQAEPAVVGKTDTYTGEIVPCHSGLHASPTPWDALTYAPGPIIWVVDIPDNAISHENPIDKYAASSRKYLFKLDTTKILRQFAAQCALDVFDKWSPPDVVREYIEGTARGEDKSSIRDAAWGAARDAAWGAARDAAWGAARDDSCSVASVTASGAARDAACDAASYAASDAACDAACNAASDAAWGAASDAAWGAARDAQRTNFNRMIAGALEKAGWRT